MAACAGLLSAWLGVAPAWGQIASDARGQDVLRQTFLSLLPRASTDTTPVAFSYFGIHLRVPRNYLVAMTNWSGGPQDFVEFRVTLPSLQPITAENQACFVRDPKVRPPGCEPLEFHLNGTRGPDAETALSRLRPLFRNQAPLPGPGGLDRYLDGAESVGSEVYTAVVDGRRLAYSCDGSAVRPERSLCTPVSDRTAHGLFLHFFFGFELLPRVVHFDAGLRALVDGFVVDEEQRGVP